MASLVTKITFSMNIVGTRCASSIAIVVMALNHYKSWLSDRPITAITLVMKFLCSGSYANDGKTVRTEHQNWALVLVVHPVKIYEPLVFRRSGNVTFGTARPN
jgi:hypothetical protein